MNKTSKKSSLTTLELQEIEAEKEKHRSISLNKGGKFTLQCGHKGRVVWISSDGKSFCVKGVSRSCSTCGKGPSASWTPTVYLFSHEEY